MSVRAEVPGVPAPTDRPVLLYDGHCAFCRRQVLRLRQLTGGRVALLSFQEAGALDSFPGLSHADCMRELKLVHADGRVEGGVSAVAGALRLGGWRGLPAALTAPGLGLAARLAYRLVARMRYWLPGRSCPSGACAVHADGRRGAGR